MAAIIVLCPVIYVLSYAPVYRLLNGTTPDYVGDSSIHFPDQPPTIRFYRPVEWLLEATPLQGPLLYLAELCGVRGGIEIDAFIRVQMRQEASAGRT